MTATDAGFEERGDSEFLFDFDQFELMDQAGVFSGVQGRVELIEGKIIQMAPASGDHGEVSGGVFYALKSAAMAAGVDKLHRFIVHATLKIGTCSAPEPDVLVIRRGESEKYARAEQAVLVAEVSISTRENDLTVKSRLYAKASVPEYWVVEPEARRLNVFREPQADGTWTSTTVLEGDDAAVSPLFAPQISIALSELF
ncbi:MAG: Uma2 family endonuclease [Gemmatimonadaceae bacterium]|nr:Uma2 family endonuclease [Caulobacter sp.]